MSETDGSEWQSASLFTDNSFHKKNLKNVRSGKEVKLIIRILLGTQSILYFVALETFIAS